jgi:hypothetical protein
MRFIPLFELPQTEHFMVTWKAGKRKSAIFRPKAIQNYAAAAL